MAKIFMVLTAIFLFVYLSYEHVVANFAITGIAWFTNVGVSYSLGHILFTWLVAWLGNYVGGGLIMGLVYGWYNDDQLSYRD